MIVTIGSDMEYFLVLRIKVVVISIVGVKQSEFIKNRSRKSDGTKNQCEDN